jgi:hypothetical protein
LRNPIYAGRPAALRYEKIEPKHRRKNKAGKTSARLKPIEEWHFFNNIKVINPPVTWDEWLELREMRKLNQLNASRNAKHNYLLRALIECEVCRSQGINRHYYGVQRTGQQPAYVCSAMWGQPYGSLGRKCPSKAIPCAKIEEDVKNKIRDFLQNPEVYLNEIRGRTQITERTITDIEVSIRDNERQYNKTLADERYKFEKLTPEAFEQEQALLKAKRIWLKEENERLKAKLANLRRCDISQEMVTRMQQNLQENLDRATNEDWRFILECLDTHILAHSDGTWDIEINIPAPDVLITNKTPSKNSDSTLIEDRIPRSSGPWAHRRMLPRFTTARPGTTLPCLRKSSRPTLS